MECCLSENNVADGEALLRRGCCASGEMGGCLWQWQDVEVIAAGHPTYKL